MAALSVEFGTAVSVSENLINKTFSTELLIITPVLTKGSGNYKDLDKTRVKLFPNFTRHYLITHTNIIGDDLLLNFGAKFQRLYYYMRNFCNLIGLKHWYFTLI